MTLPSISVSQRSPPRSRCRLALPPAVGQLCDAVLMDVTGLRGRRHSDYVRATLATAEPGICTASVMPAPSTWRRRRLNGTAAHGEDYDDTFEGGPVHAGAVIARPCSRAEAHGLAASMSSGASPSAAS